MQISDNSHPLSDIYNHILYVEETRGLHPYLRHLQSQQMRSFVSYLNYVK